LNMHIIFESVLMLFIKNSLCLLCLYLYYLLKLCLPKLAHFLEAHCRMYFIYCICSCCHSHMAY